MKPVYVVGHRNPDTDSIASAIAYAWHLGAELGCAVVPARAGPLNAQTSWLLELTGMEVPVLLTDVAPCFGDVVHALPTIGPEEPVERAWPLLHDSGTVTPVVDGDGAPRGLITALSLFELLRKVMEETPDPRNAPLSTLLDVTCERAADGSVPTFSARSRIREGIERVLRDEHDDFWVVDDDGRYVGICRKPDLLSPPRIKLVLVDHNGADQSVGSLEEAEVLDVLDHHRLENLPTRLPIRFHVEPVGSTCTLVWTRLGSSGRPLPARIAALLLGGITSDTLSLRSPTTTDNDRRAVQELSRAAFAEGSPLEGLDAEQFARELLRAGAGLDARDAADVVRSDLKIYTSGELRFGAGQAEVADEPDLSEHVPRLGAALRDLCAEQDLSFALLMVTDVVGGWSLVLAHDPPPALTELPYTRNADGTWHAPGLVSRKKQLLPAVLSILER